MKYKVGQEVILVGTKSTGLSATFLESKMKYKLKGLKVLITNICSNNTIEIRLAKREIWNFLEKDIRHFKPSLKTILGNI